VIEIFTADIFRHLPYAFSLPSLIETCYLPSISTRKVKKKGTVKFV